MNEFLQRLKLVQWAVAYVAAAFALLQGIDIIAQQFVGRMGAARHHADHGRRLLLSRSSWPGITANAAPEKLPAWSY